ncbi:MAG TPA: tetratricopeptide repeat protein [Polyangiales bacterium]|nr:tetratricopeptide repeat protein [Polyangiales bacterium]
MTSSRHSLRFASTLLGTALCSSFSLCASHAQAQDDEAAGLSEEPSVSAFTNAELPGAELPDDTRTGSDPEQAKTLFFEAKKLREAGQLAAACATYQRSLSLNPTLGTLLNLGWCERERGHVVTAHDYYRRAEVLATLIGDTKRREGAHAEAAALAPLRATLWLRLPNSSADLEVRIDDVPQPREVWSHPMFIDAGEHSVSIRAPEHEPFKESVRVQNGVRAVLLVPDLQRLPAAPLVAAEPAPKPSTMVSPEVLALHQSRQRQQQELGAMRIAAFGVGGAGVVSLGVGLLFGQLAKNANDDSQQYCRMSCSDQGRMLRETAFSHATRSTVLSVAGGVALASGVALWLLAPAPDVSPGPTLALALAPNALGPELRGTY